MRKATFHLILLAALVQLLGLPPVSAAGPSTAGPNVEEILGKVLGSDPWGIGGAVMSARATLKDKRGATSTLSLVARSRRYDPPFSKSIVRFTAPADLAGAGFLQIQKREGDDERFLFLPELKRSRRIAGNLRGTSFMGTDFSFADLDRRDLRESTSTKLSDENVGPHPCFRVQSIPKRSDSPYERIELWIRKDNYLPLKMKLYDRAKVLLKTFTAQEVRRVSGHWYITRSRMVNHVQTHETELVIENITPATDISDDEFTVRNLEKL
jgi:outer membrane lipoprotein-sorting protein